VSDIAASGEDLKMTVRGDAKNIARCQALRQCGRARDAFNAWRLPADVLSVVDPVRSRKFGS
jgi:hypothetical protein